MRPVRAAIKQLGLFNSLSLIYSCKAMNRSPCGLRLRPEDRPSLRVNLEQGAERRVETCGSCNWYNCM